VLRGAEDRSTPELAPKYEAIAGHEAAFERGRGLTRDAAIARLASCAPVVRAQGERDEDGDERAHPADGPEDV
jgi:hypothetical protein